MDFIYMYTEALAVQASFYGQMLNLMYYCNMLGGKS